MKKFKEASARAPHAVSGIVTLNLFLRCFSFLIVIVGEFSYLRGSNWYLTLIGSLAALLVISYFLLLGKKWMYFLVIAGTVLNVLIPIISGTPKDISLPSLLFFVLVLSKESRAYFMSNGSLDFKKKEALQKIDNQNIEEL